MTISNRVIDLVNGESESEIDAACSDDCRANSEEDEEISDDTFQCRCATQCLSKLSTDQIESHRLNVAEMEKNEKEMFIMGVLQPVTSATTWRGDRKRKRVTYSYNGEKICRTAFQHLFDIGRRTLTALTTHMHLNGKVPRIHGNKHRKPRHALRYAETKNCVDILVRYADVNGLPQPAAPRGRDNEPPIYLPASLTKYAIHKEYKEECARQDIRCLGLTSFKGTWSQCVPHIKISTPRDDVCQKCELLRKKIKDAVSDRDKPDAGNAFTSHVTHAQEERVFYKESIAKALEETPKHREPGPVPPCSSELKTAHYTFDYCQQVGIPQHARQIGSLYFMSTRKVQIFGFRDDGLPMQYNYLIDENQSIGPDGGRCHGPDSVISMVDHALTFYGHGEKDCSLHCDNCPGQNKNRFVLAYLPWRTMLGLHENMQIPGHTRCYVDGGFAHLKKLYRRSDVDCLDELVDIVNKSASTNTAVNYTTNDGEERWCWSDWKTFLPKYFKPFPGINKFYHFLFRSSEPGVVSSIEQ